MASTFGEGLFGAIDLGAAFGVLHDRADAIEDNNLGSIEQMLVAQAAVLNSMFMELSRRGGANLGHSLDTVDAYLRLALKAQSQSRATLETLATIKNPPLVIAKQANIAAGAQQVNNGACECPPTRAVKSGIAPNELLGTQHGKRLEPRTAGPAIGSDPALEALGAIDGTTDSGR